MCVGVVLGLGGGLFCLGLHVQGRLRALFDFKFLFGKWFGSAQACNYDVGRVCVCR